MGTVDLSRDGTDFRKRYAGMRAQQGRVLSDDDFNNAAQIDEEEMRTTRVDVIGPVGSPDMGFLPVAPAPLPLGAGIDFTISPGTLYLGGLRLVEPDTSPNPETFQEQKDWLNFDKANTAICPLVPAAGSRIDLVWIEAWQQPVASEEDSEKYEASLGSADTAMNVRTMRRVRVLPGVAGEDCAAAWAGALAAWAPALGTLQPDMEIATGATLRVSFVVSPDPGDLCSPPSAGGYLGAENQAIRVQMIDATHYTWGFDNASPLHRIQTTEVIHKGVTFTQIKLLNAPKDAAHWPLKGQVIELLPWSASLPNGETLADIEGVLGRVTTSYNPDDQTLEVDVLVPPAFRNWTTRSDVAEFFDGSALDDYYFMRVWNRGDDITSAVAIPIAQGDLGTTGLHVDFLGGPLRRCDFWIIGARPATPDRVVPWLLETPNSAPPNGVKRYRAPLGLIRWTVAGATVIGEVIDDCRPPFLPLTKQRGCCKVTVGDGVTSFGMFASIQKAVDSLPATGGTVCVLPGTYNESVHILNKHDIVIHGCDARARVSAIADKKLGDLPAFLLEGCRDVAIEHLGIEAGPRSAIEMFRCARIAVRQCVIQMRDLPTLYQAIFVRYSKAVVLERNLVDNLPRELVPGALLNSAFDGVSPPPPVVIAHATRGGIQIGGGCEDVKVLGNVIRGGIFNGITLGSLVFNGGNDDDPDQPGSKDPCDPCRPLDNSGDDPGGHTTVTSAGNLYDIEIRDNTIEDMGANGIAVVRFFDLAKTPILISVFGLAITHNIIRRCVRREIEPPKAAMQWIIGYGGIALAFARDLRVCDNEITGCGVNHLEPICGLFAIWVDNLLVDRNRMRDNGPREGEEPATMAKVGTRGGIWVWMAVVLGDTRAGQAPFKRYDGVPAALIRDNVIIAPIGRAITLFAVGGVDVARNRLVSQSTRAKDLELLATTVLIGDFGISNELTLGLLWAFVVLGSGVLLGKPVDACALTEFVGLIDPNTGQPWPPLTTVWPSGKLLVTENQISSDTIDSRNGASLSSVFLSSLDDVGFTDNQCEIESVRHVFLTDAMVVGGSVRVADNRLAETWLRAFYSGWSIGAMNTTTDNQATHCLRADATLPNMLMFKDNLSLIQAYCPNACRG